ncbi:class A beta-lactamase-related serine hydrolase [Streptomyces rhizosphaerihabitans]|uniref:class A beta-lactamase-related serine hydrolase n=1 Tax=Streptomyces rhizosphaerihabitans TaxID=1266770 RepID=UPI0021BFEF65|nr:class A beta-lactamase-related serine hydrolase [Streptomyces rhizosphaerihabitans]MCT9004463.1 class A beta-lactamase-related serine hydrolase [Streptomyces rhizosphaerihabitans]
MDRHRARGRRARPSRRKPLLYTVVASAVLVGATAAGTVYMKAQAHDGPAVVSSAAAATATASPSSSPAAGEEASVEPVAEPSVDRDALLAKALKAVPVADGAKTAVAVLDLDSGESAAHGDTAFDTASIVKVNILATLLLQAQDADRHLTTQEKTYATAMIENSDNASATALWAAIGRADGLDTANKRFGLTDTQGGDGELWGLTQTTASDQLTLLRQVFGDDSKLSDTSRSYLQGLMGKIETDQRWGVSAAADGSQWALKNGWLARSTTGLWDVNSIGRISADGHDYLVATLSNGNSTQAKGISLVEAVAKAALSAFQDAAED